MRTKVLEGEEGLILYSVIWDTKNCVERFKADAGIAVQPAVLTSRIFQMK